MKEMVVFALTLIRHGETGANKENIIQGQLDVPLSETGIKQAQLLAKRLQQQRYSHVYASDLSRAKQTAQTILERNEICKSPIVHDPRLRERKFGDVEGKSYSELRGLAKRANQSITTFTPTGAETVQQVKRRAIQFFQELCDQLIANSTKSNPSLSSTENTVSNSNTSTDAQNQNSDSERLSDRGETPKSPLSPNEGGPRLKRERNDSLNSDGSDADLHKTEISEAWAQTIAKSKAELLEKVNALPDATNPPEMLCVYVPTRSKHKKHNVGSKKTNLQNEIENTFNEESQLTVPEGSNNGVHPDLSPLVEEKLSCSPSLKRSRKPSVDSNHDDSDPSTYLVANVLVVSHGGFLKELMCHFVEDLGCSIPGGRGQALRISPNTGLSKFTITIENQHKPKIICLSIHDKDHLTSGRMDTCGNYAL